MVYVKLVSPEGVVTVTKLTSWRAHDASTLLREQGKRDARRGLLSFRHMLSNDVKSRIEEDVEAHLSGRNRTLGLELRARANRLSASAGAMSGNALFAYLEAGKDDIAFRADYIADAILRAHKNVDGTLTSNLRDDLKAELASRIAAHYQQVAQVLRGFTKPPPRVHFDSMVDTEIGGVANEKTATLGIKIAEYCDALERSRAGSKPMTEENITSHGQQGGITAHTVTLNQGASPPPPSPPDPEPWWKSWWAGISGLILVIAAIAEILHYFGVSPWEKERSMPDDPKVNVTSYNQRGGITAHTVIVGPQPRSMSNPAADKLKADIFREVSKDKPIDVVAPLGDAEATRFASEIHAFLSANGFKVRYPKISQAVFADPQHGVSMADKGDHIEFVVGAAN